MAPLNRLTRAALAVAAICWLGCTGTLGRAGPVGGDGAGGDANGGDVAAADLDLGDPVAGDGGGGADALPSGDDDGGDPGSLVTVRECDTPDAAWIWCDDFESDRSSAYFEGSLPPVAGVGVGGSHGARIVFVPGTSGAGGVKIAFGRTPQSYFRPVDDGTQDYREIYWRMVLRNQPGWVGGGGDKLSRATIFASDTSWAQAMIAHVWSGGDGSHYLGIDPASGTDAAGTLQTTTYNDFANLRWLGWRVGQTPLFDAAHVGVWYCVEAHVRLNDAGQANGVFELWIDDQLEAAHTELNWVGAYSAYGINAVLFENYWNDTSPVTQERYFDNLVVSTARIGCR